MIIQDIELNKKPNIIVSHALRTIDIAWKKVTEVTFIIVLKNLVLFVIKEVPEIVNDSNFHRQWAYGHFNLTEIFVAGCDAKQAVNVLRTFLERSDKTGDIVSALYDIETAVDNEIFANLKQTKITEFFLKQ